MSSIALVLKKLGHRISGSDLQETQLTRRLKESGIEVFLGHSTHNLESPDLLAVSSAIDESNAEVSAANEAGIPVLTRAQILSAICKLKPAIAVTGTHGKTTTSAMLVHILKALGQKPSYVIGGELKGSGTGADWDKGDFLVVEADESDATFLQLPVTRGVITSAEPDHIERYGSFAEELNAFKEFAGKCKDLLVLNIEDLEVRNFHQEFSHSKTYGRVDKSESIPDYQIVEASNPQSGIRPLSASADLKYLDARLQMHIPIPGRHNISNAAAALSTAIELGLNPKKAAMALDKFPGISRRFELKGESEGTLFVDDYAHLPTEISDTLNAVLGWGRIVCVFQPHRYSRTENLWRDFADAFEGADLLAITDIYSAGEKARPGISGKLILEAVLGKHPRKEVAWLAQDEDVMTYLTRKLKPGDVCLTLNAGDLNEIIPAVQEGLKKQR